MYPIIIGPLAQGKVRLCQVKLLNKNASDVFCAILSSYKVIALIQMNFTGSLG